MIGQAQEDLPVPLGNVPALVGQPVRGEVEARLYRHEQVQHHDLAGRAISLESLPRRREHGPDPGHGIADGSQPLGEKGPINHGGPPRGARLPRTTLPPA